MAVLRVGEQYAAEGVGSRFISCSEARAIAVEDIAKPMPATSATAGERPTRNSSSTTPNSAKWRIASGAVTSARPQGPMAAPAAR
jgi:hypothetical protein